MTLTGKPRSLALMTLLVLAPNTSMSWETDQPMAVTDPAPITVGVELEFLIPYHFKIGNEPTPWEQGIIDQGKTLTPAATLRMTPGPTLPLLFGAEARQKMCVVRYSRPSRGLSDAIEGVMKNASEH